MRRGRGDAIDPIQTLAPVLRCKTTELQLCGPRRPRAGCDADLFRLDVGCADYLSPLFCFFDDPM